MARLLAILAFISSPIAAATIYTEERDPIYERASIALFCMNHFYNRTTGYLGMQAGMSAQADLAKRLPLLPDGEKLAGEMRLALNAMTKDQGNKAVPTHCWQYIPKDHGLTSDEILRFLKRSSLD
ncbi:TPA: hypothetical protein ACGJ7L_002300 [Pseudomonas aeruginosa]|uniref:Uncharacterized protein n=3 Tax=Pseudomonas aeruginosa TaxID=287 RepID=A0A9P1R1K3_PSEAI|nr:MULTISPECIES: hypothetical protein [Pseudomonas]CDI89695.1 hypothetical protein BN889_01630 [Pseudomonas aeruginosa PA38182]AXL77925.1 hypothetical protein Y82_3875 [Pseudomonas aeruginosa]EIU2563453.1 hypothetical protein [Pseudomonas aeruginosa]EIU2664283.1 hypothetical protein [Pseudomonas aeruginosa]EIU2682096.1 hypothetical protein [Pseudomonas aeruginosa]